MGKATLSGVLQLEILDYLYAVHPNPIAWCDFVEQFGSLDDPYLIVNIQQLIADKLIAPKVLAMSTNTKHVHIVTAKLKLTTDGYQFIAHNPPCSKY
ncbi:TPA: hypothetical protein ACKQJM_003214 [Serratia marcescens]